MSPAWATAEAIPTGWNHSAQGCEQRATLGLLGVGLANSERVESGRGGEEFNPHIPLLKFDLVPFQQLTELVLGERLRHAY